MLLEARNIGRSFFTAGKRYTALAPLTLSVTVSEFLVVTGPSGAGKSTLLNLLSGLDRPSHGEVMFEGASLAHLKEREIAHLRNSCFGFIFQTPHLLPEKTVMENVALPFSYGKRVVEVDVEKRCSEILEYVGLDGFGMRYPDTLSGGEMQRVVFARALARNPKVIFADEPTGSLDAKNSQRILELLRKQVKKGHSVIMASHDADAVLYGTRVVHLEKLESYPKQVPA